MILNWYFDFKAKCCMSVGGAGEHLWLHSESVVFLNVEVVNLKCSPKKMKESDI